MFRIFPRKVNRPFVSPNCTIIQLYSSNPRSCRVCLGCPLFDTVHSANHSVGFRGSSRQPHRRHHSFHQSHAAVSTDVTVRPPPNASNPTEESDKKWKWEVGETNDHVLSDAQHGRFPNLFHANKHLGNSAQDAKEGVWTTNQTHGRSCFSCTCTLLHPRFIQDKLSCG